MIGYTMLGDIVESALTSIGITDDRVSKWLGKPCGCKERKVRLNQLEQWARRILSGRVQQLQQAKTYLDEIMEGW